MIKKVLLALTGIVLGLVLLLVVAVACVLYVPSVRQTVLDKGLVVAREKTGLDIDWERLYLSPFHHSPKILYNAYKGREDLPLCIEADSLFVGHRGQDTLLYAHSLRLRATLLADTAPLTARSIRVEQLHLDTTTFHSDSLIASVGVNVIVGNLDATSPGLVLAKGEYPLRGLRLSDAYVGIDLRPTPPDTTAKDTTPTLMAFDVPDGELRNMHFELTPTGLNVRTKRLAVNVLADVGGSLYDVRRIDGEDTELSVGSLLLPFDTLYGDARVDLARSLITSGGLHARSDSLGAKVDLSTTALDLETMRVDVAGDADFRGSMTTLRGFYDIDDEAYDVQLDVEQVDLSSFLQNSPNIVVAGDIHAAGKGIDFGSAKTKSHVKVHLTDCLYDYIDVSGLDLDATLASKAVDGTLHLPVEMKNEKLKVKGETEHRFHVAEFLTPKQMQVDYRAHMRNVRARISNKDLRADNLNLHFTTDKITALDVESEGLILDVKSPMHVLTLVDNVQPLLAAVGDSVIINALTSLSDLTMLDTIRHLIPDIAANIVLTSGSPIQSIIDDMGLQIKEVMLSLSSDSEQTGLTLDASIPEILHPEDSTALRLPPAQAAMRVMMTEGKTTASLDADSRIRNGVMKVSSLKTDAALRLHLERTERLLRGTGHLRLDDLSYGSMDLGSRTADITLSPSERFENAIRAEVRLDDVPLDLVDSILQNKDIDLSGAVRAHATADGLPAGTDLSAEVIPLAVSAYYKPYEVELSLGEEPIVMEHNKVHLNAFPIYGVDSTFVALTGGLDLDSMYVDIALAADSFVPAKLTKEGPFPVYGELAADINGKVSGALDNILADVDVTILPNTDITYPIDEKNMAQVKPYGTVNVRYGVAEKALNLGGRINVDEGEVRYSPKMYPIMPFQVDSGSNVTFHGPLGHTMLDVSASQKVKASVQSEGEETRRVDFTTGVRVHGILDSVGINALDFFLEAPEDETITRELAQVEEETREGLAATLLATGMYVGESNVGAQNGGYALSSIINSRINAALSNSKMGKVIDIDFSSGKSKHAAGETNDLNIALSKSFFDDRLRIALGATISDNPDVMASNGLLSSITADYKLTKSGNVLLRVFSQRDYNNILEGELFKYGIGVRATKEWQHKEFFRGDSLIRTYGLAADADVAYRSNNSLGPNLTLTSSVKNLLGKGETFSIKGTGAYYWALRNRHPGDPKKTDTYKLGVNASLLFPYLHWVGDNNPEGDTRYMVGYQYENVAGGYGVHKLSGSFTYFIRSSRYVTHAFTPFSLSVVGIKAESDSLMSMVEEYPQLIKILAGDEFIPSIGYNFIYNDYRSKRAVNTMLDLGVKESGNIMNGIYCLFGYKWNDRNKPLGSITFNQFVKLKAELHNKFNITDKVCIATRLYAGANVPMGNSVDAPLSEAFYAGGPNSMRYAATYSYGPGNFYSEKYNQSVFHAGDVKLEANMELRFPLFWKIFGATFVDAGNVWRWYSMANMLEEEGYADYMERLQLRQELYDGILDNPDLAKQIALGTGFGLRLDFEGLVVRLDLGVGIHAPFQTYKYDKDWKPDYTKPITTYFNMPSFLDAVRLNFGIGYPF